MKRSTLPWLITAVSFSSLLAGCGGNQATGNAGAAAGQIVPPIRHAAMTPYTALQLRPSIASRIDQIQGLKWSVVLQEANKVYVGTYPEYSGNAQPGAVPPADSYDYGPKDRMGTLDPKVQSDIHTIVTQALPNVRAVLITTDVASADVLRGYAEYLKSGGDMQPYMTQFHQRTAMIWPRGKGVDPNRPSASPDFGTLGTPADHRTPVRGTAGR